MRKIRDYSDGYQASQRRSSRMLKQSPFSPARPRRAETRLFPYIVLASFRSSTYLTRSRNCLGSLGWAGEKSNASGLHSLRPCWTNFLSILRFVHKTATSEILLLLRTTHGETRLAFLRRPVRGRIVRGLSVV
jgi:hypothetical protein